MRTNKSVCRIIFRTSHNVYYVKLKRKVLQPRFYGQLPHSNLHTGATLKTIALFTVMTFGFFGIITALARPDIVQKQYAEIRAPIAQYFAEKNTRVWHQAKESERARWMMRLHLPADCTPPKTAIRELECSNTVKLHTQTFEQNWANKVQSGWKPDGVAN